MTSGETLRRVLLRIGARAKLLAPASPEAQRELAEQMLEEVAAGHPDRMVKALLANKRRYMEDMALTVISYAVKQRQAQDRVRQQRGLRHVDHLG